jgi:hypothetical protein
MDVATQQALDAELRLKLSCRGAKLQPELDVP